VPFRELFCSAYITLLSLLDPAPQKQGSSVCYLHEIDAITRSIVNSQLGNASAQRSSVAAVPKRKAAKSNADSRLCVHVSDLVKPPPIAFGLEDVSQEYPIGYDRASRASHG
jgi:hypothetical protein